VPLALALQLLLVVSESELQVENASSTRSPGRVVPLALQLLIVRCQWQQCAADDCQWRTPAAAPHWQLGNVSVGVPGPGPGRIILLAGVSGRLGGTGRAAAAAAYAAAGATGTLARPGRNFRAESASDHLHRTLARGTDATQPTLDKKMAQGAYCLRSRLQVTKSSSSTKPLTSCLQ